MIQSLAGEDLDWESVDVFQVDERVAPRGDPGRNLTALEELLVNRGRLPRSRLHPMWVDREDLDEAAVAYQQELVAVAGEPPELDVVHLGLGEDGHTASLFPADGALRVRDRWVALTDERAGFRRMTLTLPVLNRARSVVWLVTGNGKAAMVAKLAAGGATFPAGRVSRRAALLITDSAAGSRVRLP
jgi:6-phosphogluconolactonase